MGMFFGLQQAQNGELATESNRYNFPSLVTPRNFFLFLLMGLWFLAHGNPPHVDEDGKCQQDALFQGTFAGLSQDRIGLGE